MATADDVVAVEHPVSRNVTIFALTDAGAPLTDMDKATIAAHYQRRDAHIAGISVRQVDPTILPFYVHVVAVYAPRQYGADDVTDAVQTAVAAYLAQTERIGASIWSGEIHDAAEVGETISVGVRVFPGAPDVTGVAPENAHAPHCRRLEYGGIGCGIRHGCAGNAGWRSMDLVTDERGGVDFNDRGQTFAPDAAGRVSVPVRRRTSISGNGQ